MKIEKVRGNREGATVSSLASDRSYRSACARARSRALRSQERHLTSFLNHAWARWGEAKQTDPESDEPEGPSRHQEDWRTASSSGPP
ncbi:hypothetical protein E2C01_006063 [Portunus trituberculatus]|uniref:Uncharacterized protein n=1 Tax=Portunus trituberculatus TaxID=210409 RepID=A0A5B7CU96_PORTR|nr:hypothetical protein [Portunus trituberculatus]